MTSHSSRTESLTSATAGGLVHMSECTVLAGSVLAAGQARRFMTRVLCAHHAQAAHSAVTLAASELVTQAVLGGHGPVTVTLTCHVTAVTVAVSYPTDEARYDTRLRLADEVAAMIIEGISRASGRDVVDGQQRMWCTIPTGFVPVTKPPEQRREVR